VAKNPQFWEPGRIKHTREIPGWKNKNLEYIPEFKLRKSLDWETFFEQIQGLSAVSTPSLP
jgi:hypothetical protein